jgi:phytoene synthase
VSPEEALVACEAAVRQSDPDRYFASFFAPADKRALLYVLYAFNHELARAVEVAREPMMVEIRLQWWREAVDEAREDRPRMHPVAMGLGNLLGQGISPGALEALIDARGEEIPSAPFANLAALEAHADATSGVLMRIAATLLNPRTAIDQLAREAGIAYGLTGILRSIPFHAARGKSFLPADLLACSPTREMRQQFPSLPAPQEITSNRLAGCRWRGRSSRQFCRPRSCLPISRA